jgi:malate dehydrogenase (quinone)
MQKQYYDVVTVGAGVSGAGFSYLMARFATPLRTLLLEKASRPAMVNSNPRNNAQTSHDGSTETNYSLKKALMLRPAALALRTYVTRRNAPGLYRKTKRMVLGVGHEQVAMLRERYATFKPHYPDLSLVGPRELQIIEPKLMEGRDPSEPVAAIVTDEGFAINYQRLAECLIEDAERDCSNFAVRYNTRIVKVTRDQRSGHCTLTLDSGDEIEAGVVVFAAGAYSLSFAHMLGFGEKYGILSVAGDFYTSVNGPILNGKVYRPQDDNIPFAAAHGDPDVLNSNETRFGPTTMPIPMFERRHYDSVVPYMKSRIVSGPGIFSLLKIMWQRRLIGYVTKNFMYRLPLIGKWLFLQQLKQIVPTLKYDDIVLRKNAGGVRPQIVNMETGELEMGEQLMQDGNVIVLTTPSPGASVCIRNGYDVLRRVEALLQGVIVVDHARVKNELGLT